MNGQLAQAAALVSYGNRRLHGGDARGFDWQENTTIQYAHSFEFVRHTGGNWLTRRSTVVAGNPGEWLAWVAASGASSLTLLISTDLKWLIRVVPGDVWQPRLESRLARNDKKPWKQVYVTVPNESVVQRLAKDVTMAATDLETALESIIAFARQVGLVEWVSRFGVARSILQRDDAPIPYYPDMIASGVPDAHRLAAAAATASMFTGPDSWNDLGSDIRRRADYKVVTRTTCEAVLDGIAAAANAVQIG